MKKLICILSSLVILLSVLVGCQRTPDRIVVGKDSETMIEKAKTSGESIESDESNRTLREKTQAPESLKYELEKNKMKIVVDAEVDIPESNKISIIRVQAGDFLQEQITFLWNELINNTPMFYTSNEMTKSEIEAAIIFARGKVKQAESEEDEVYYQKQIEYFNSIYDSVPEQLGQTVATGQLQELFLSTYGSDEKVAYTGINATSEDGTISFHLNNSYQNRYGNITQARFEYHNRFNDVTQEDGQPDIKAYDVGLMDENTPEEAQYLSLSPLDAKKEVVSFLSATNIPFMVRSVALKKSIDREYYSFSCVREVGDIPSAQIMGETYSEDEAGYAETWEYENLTICIDDSGITDVVWEYPIEIIEIVVDDSTLKEFADIQDIFNKMMYVTYEFQAQNTEELLCKVTNIRLEIMRINEQDAQRVGLFVPVWNFYGVRTMKNKDGANSETSKIILMAINAIDGSIIDTSKGY